MVWNKYAAADYARAHANAHSTGRCAEYTRKAINAGGVDVGRTPHAKDYGPLLHAAGFDDIGADELPVVGDVVILQPYAGGNPSGHMAIFDGQDWYSDFKQRDMWGGPGYRAARPAYKIYRKEAVFQRALVFECALV